MTHKGYSQLSSKSDRVAKVITRAHVSYLLITHLSISL